MKAKELFTVKNLVIAGLMVFGAKKAYDYFKTTKTYSDIKKKAEEVSAPETMTVIRKFWTRTVTVSKYVEETCTGWSVPDGAYDVKTERRARDSDRVTIGAVSVPIEKMDIYYIYKIRTWKTQETFRHSEEGQYSDVLGAAAVKKIEESIKQNNSSNDIYLNPEVGDCKITSIKTTYTIVGTNDKTDDLVETNTDQYFHSSIAIGDKLDYRKGMCGVIKNLRRHIEKGDVNEAGTCEES